MYNLNAKSPVRADKKNGQKTRLEKTGQKQKKKNVTGPDPGVDLLEVCGAVGRVRDHQVHQARAPDDAGVYSIVGIAAE